MEKRVIFFYFSIIFASFIFFQIKYNFNKNSYDNAFSTNETIFTNQTIFKNATINSTAAIRLKFNDLNKTISRVFCIILTSNKSIEKKAITVNNIWARKCDKHFFITLLNQSFSNSSIETTLHGLPVLQPKNLTVDSYKLLGDKMFKSIITVYENYSDFDWYLKADDDTFIFVDNLRRFLATKDPSKPITFGYDLKKYVEQGYHSGGAGYVWSKEAMKRIGGHLRKDYKACTCSGIEDIDVAKCFRKVGVYPKSSLDEQGRERFHPLDMKTHLLGRFPKWMYHYAKNPLLKGENCCSDGTISFHYVSEPNMKKLGLLLNQYESMKLRGNKSSLASILYTL